MVVNVGGYRNGSLVMGGFPYLLLGIVSGYYYETADFKLETAATLMGEANANSGISIVVPAEQLKALLQSPQLQRLRDSQFPPKR